MTRQRLKIAAAWAVWAGLTVASGAGAAPSDVATSPLPLQAVMSSDGRYVAWAASSVALTVTVVDRLSSTSQEYQLAELAGGVPGSTVRLDGISDDGRYLTYGVIAGGTFGYTTVLRFDRVASTTLYLFDNQGVIGPLPDAVTGVSVSRDGQTFAWVTLEGTPTVARVMVRLASEPTARAVGTTCVLRAFLWATVCAPRPAVSGDGRTVLYSAGDLAPAALAYYDVASGTHTYYPQVQALPSSLLATAGAIVPNRDASLVLVRTTIAPSTVFDRATTRVDRLGTSTALAMTDDGGRVVATGAPGVYESSLLDRRAGLLVPFPGALLAVALTADGSAVLGVERDDAAQLYRLQLRALDEDNDGMLDLWETTFGLNPGDPADAALDANGDGVTNLQTFLDRRHPTAVAAHARFFAEGAAGSFFDTVVSLFNPGSAPATVVTRLQGSVAGQTASHVSVLAPGARADVASCCLATATPAEFATMVETDAPVVVERRMSWDRVSGYGSHASTAADAPATAWYFAEGATIAGFQTFLLLQNPGDAPATADVDFLLPAGGAVRRAYTVPASSRLTVWVNQEGAPLTTAEFAMRVTASLPIVAERAMYRDVAGQPFGAGSNAMGATAPATTWSFAEGATGPFFDTFLLVANTSPTAGTVTATYTAETASGPLTVTRTYAIAGDSRLTIWLDQQDPALADAAVSSVLTADVPIVAERAMWWPGTAGTWEESHVELGATARGVRWAIADAELNPLLVTDTFVLVDADTGGMSASATVTAYPSQGFPIPRTVALAQGRNTLWMAQLFPELSGQRFSLVIESQDRPGGAATLTVEKAIYSRNFAAGAAARATPLP